MDPPTTGESLHQKKGEEGKLPREEEMQAHQQREEKKNGSTDPKKEREDAEGNQPEDAEKHRQERRRRVLDKTVCNKCGENSIFVIRKLDGYCKECFLASFTRKVRMDIGKHRLIKQQEKIIIAYSGGNRSSALVAFVREMMDSKKRPFRVTPVVVHINEEVLFPKHCNTQRLEEMACFAKTFGFESAVFGLEDLFASQLDAASEERSSTRQRLQTLFESLKTVNAKEEMLRLLRHDLFQQIAVHLGVSKVLVGDCSTQLAMHCLNLIAQGRGASIPLVTDFATETNSVYFLKPFRFMAAKEIALYNFVNNVNVIPRATFSMAAAFNASFERLTEHFIANLEEDFPSTTASVLRTAQKIAPEPSTGAKEICVLCSTEIESRDLHSLAKHHRNLDIHLMCDKKDDRSTCGDCSCQDNTTSVEATNLVRLVCYGCRNLLQQATTEQLPLSHVNSRVQKQLSRQQMRHEIQDFLLDDDDHEDS
eukprot:m.166151 g.166151  ORF g.166151 m.166151 type:complete len:480 (-) comp16436_c1_seq2:31-1470(-)